MALAPLTFQRDIQSLIHGKKKVWNWREAENPVRYAYNKLLREKDETRRVLPVDPFAEVYTLRPGITGIFMESLDGMGDVWSFLIEGSERALLIDTGFGLGDLKGLTEELLGGKPYEVANTHSHFDHAYGNYQFDRIYCHEYEAFKLQRNMNSHVWDYLFDECGEGIWYDLRREDLIPFRPYEIVPVPDGHVFDLGDGHEVELIFMGGHSTGHCGFLDRKNRIFFPGDDCCVGTVGIGMEPNIPYAEYATVEALHRELLKIIAREAEYDSMFPSHGVLETGPVMLHSLAATCEAVLQNPEDCDIRLSTTHGERLGKMIFESGYLQYGKDAVYQRPG